MMETLKTSTVTIEPCGAAPVPFASRVWQILTLGDRLGRRVAVVIWLSAAIAASLFLGWGWLVAVGLSSIVLSVLPCAAMCALGLCAGSGKKCSDQTAAKAPPEAQP